MQRNKQIYLWFSILFIVFFIPTSFLQAAGLIDVDFKNADIRDVLRALASQEGVNLYIDNEVTGNVTISLNKVTFTEALTIITQNNNLTFTKTDNVYQIKPIDDSFLKVEYSDSQLTVEAKNIKLATLLETISQKSGVSLVPAPELQEKVSIVITPSPVNDAIEAVLTQTNCMGEKIGKLTYIRKKSTQSYSFTVNYQAGLLTVDAKNIPLPVLCRTITEKTGASIVPDQNVTQNVTIFFQNLNLPDSLNVLCETNSLTLFKDGEAWRIARQTGAFRVRLKDNQLSVDADGIEVSLLVKEIARQAGLNILLDREVRGNITAHFQNLPFYQGLSMMLENQGLILEKQPNYYFVRTNTNQNKNIRIVYDPETQNFDLDIQSAPLNQILNEMSRRANLSIVIMAQVNWTVNNVRIQKLTFTQAMEYLFKGTIFTYKLIDNIYVIGDGLTVRPENSDFAVVKIYPLKYVKADQFLNTLPPVFPKQNIIQIAEKNALVVSGPNSLHTLFSDYLGQVDVASIEDRTEVIKINYLKAEDVLKLIPPSIPKTDLIILKEANALVVTGPQNLLTQVKSYIEKIDQVNPLIVFDILVVQVSDSKGFTWNAPSGTIKLSNGKNLNINPGSGGISLTEPSTVSSSTGENDDKVLASITSLVRDGKARIVANPTITTLNGYPANFNVSTKWSYTVPTEKQSTGDTTTVINETVKTYDTGVYITITPWVSANNQITMEIKPKVSEFGDAPSGSILPSTSERSTETTVRVNDGETIIISGLKNSRKQKTISKVPVLGHIPVIGYLFKNVSDTETQDEFVIVITPKLIYEKPGKPTENPMLDKFSPATKIEIEPGLVTDEERKKLKK